MQRKFWVYIMSSRTGTFYIGMTHDLEIRVRQHKAGEIQGFSAKYTARAWFITKASITFREPSTARSSGRGGGGRRRSRSLRSSTRAGKISPRNGERRCALPVNR